MIPFLFFIGTVFHPDAYVICGKDPLEECLVTVNQCLQDSEKLGYGPDEAFEWCAETTDPNIIHLWE